MRQSPRGGGKMCCGCLALRGTQLGPRGPCLNSLPSARKGHESLGADQCVCVEGYTSQLPVYKLKGLETTSPLLPPAAPPPNPFLRSIISCPEHHGAGVSLPGGWGATAASRASRATPPLLSLPAGTAPLCVSRPGGERHPQGCEKVLGRPGPVWPIPPGGAHGWEVAPGWLQC